MARSFKILVVEDSPADIALIQDYFDNSSLSIDLSIAQDGKYAVDFLSEALDKEPSQLPNLIFLDLNLPRKSGHEVLREIKSDPILKVIPVIVLTTSNSASDIKNSYFLAASCYLTKPADYNEFQTMMNSVESLFLREASLPQQHC